MNHNKRKNKQKNQWSACRIHGKSCDQISRSQTKLGMVGGMDTCHLVLELETDTSLRLHGSKLRSTIKDYTDSQRLDSTLTQCPCSCMHGCINICSPHVNIYTETDCSIWSHTHTFNSPLLTHRHSSLPLSAWLSWSTAKKKKNKSI